MYQSLSAQGGYQHLVVCPEVGVSQDELTCAISKYSGWVNQIGSSYSIHLYCKMNDESYLTIDERMTCENANVKRNQQRCPPKYCSSAALQHYN